MVKSVRLISRLEIHVCTLKTYRITVHTPSWRQHEEDRLFTRERERGRGGGLQFVINPIIYIYPVNFTLVKLEGVEPIKLTIQGARFLNFRVKEITVFLRL